MMAGDQMRIAMQHLAHTAVELQGDANAGYIDYDDYDDRRGCRPVDSSDDEEEEVDLTEFDEGDQASNAYRLDDDAMAADPPPPPPTGSSFSKLESELDAQFHRLKAQMHGGVDTDSEAPFEGGGTAFGGGGTAPEQTTTAEGPSQAEGAPDAGAKSAAGEGVSDFYDESYFDSDDGAAETADGASAEDPSAEPAAPAGKSRRRKKRPVIPNDTLFYDPDIDTENQQWMDRQRDLKGRNPFDEFGGEEVEGDGAPGSSASGDGDGAKPHDGQAAAAAEHNAKRGMQPTATSDAILNCSACMSTLCLDCQRHDTYADQFRAMFVHNCHVDRSETLIFKKKETKRRFKDKKAGRDPTGARPDEEYHPVACGECNAVVAVYDHDEIYHFFDVIVSLP
eukprot:m.122692 g.122692  ORF g.122692 m.122692 type:complete len:394 (-) comp21969_c0_seq1:2959-4140(-)